MARFGCPFLQACWGLGCQPAAPGWMMGSPLPSRKDGSQMTILHIFFILGVLSEETGGAKHILNRLTKKITKGNALQIQHYLGTAKISGYSILIKYVCAETMVWALFSVNRSFSTWCYQISLQRRVTQYKHAYASFSQVWNPNCTDERSREVTFAGNLQIDRWVYLRIETSSTPWSSSELGV